MTLRTALNGAFMACAIAMFAGPGHAENQGTSDQRNACMADAFRFCMSAIPNHQRIEACLRTNRRSLSTACYREIYDDGPAPQKPQLKRVVTEHAPE